MITPQDMGGVALVIAVGICALLMGLGRRFARPPCSHKWATFTEMTCHPRGRPEVLAGQIHGLRCEKCGDITQRYVGLR